MKDKKEPQRRLGRGLDALFRGGYGDEATDGGPPSGPILPDARVFTVPISRLAPNPFQPRRTFDEETLAGLARSIREQGLLQPLVVRPSEENPGSYEIVAGERRWRAAQGAQLHEVPVVVHSFTDEETLTVGMIENIQRADLTPVEEAEAYLRLVRDYGRTQQEVADVVGKSRSHVANMMRLMDLPPEVLVMLSDGRLTMGHGRALLGAKDPLVLAHRIETEGLSVRAVETLVSEQAEKEKNRRQASRVTDNADTLALERRLGSVLGLRVRIRSRGTRGTVTLSWESLEQLDSFVERLSDSGVGQAK